MLSAIETGSIVLVAGTDASGKTTLLSEAEGILVGEQLLTIEPRGTQQIRDFRAVHLLSTITPEFICEREDVFMSVHEQITPDIVAAKNVGRLVFTTASPVITMVAHASMLETIGRTGRGIAKNVDTWLEKPNFVPDAFVLLEASMATIKERIHERQLAGDKDEVIWGFNSPFYLLQYQRALRLLHLELTNRGMQTYMFDTSRTPTSEILEAIKNGLS